MWNCCSVESLISEAKQPLTANLWGVQEQLVKVFEPGSHGLQDAVVD